MTIIAARVWPDGGEIAADILASAYVLSDLGSKLFRLSPQIAVGVSGTTIVNRWVRRDLAAALTGQIDDWRDQEKFLVLLEDVWDLFFLWCRERGHGHSVGDSYVLPSDALVVVPGRIYQLEGDGSVSCYRDEIAAIGSGCQVAMGALAHGAAPAQAAEIASRLVAGVGGEIERMGVAP